jgi:hypothetical protein
MTHTWKIGKTLGALLLTAATVWAVTPRTIDRVCSDSELVGLDGGDYDGICKNVSGCDKADDTDCSGGTFQPDALVGSTCETVTSMTKHDGPQTCEFNDTTEDNDCFRNQHPTTQPRKCKRVYECRVLWSQTEGKKYCGEGPRLSSHNKRISGNQQCTQSSGYTDENGDYL